VTLGLLNNVDLFVHPYYRMGSYKYYDLIYDGRPAYFLNNTGNFHTFGNVNVGTKINVWGNDDGRTAFGVAPYLSFPTDRGPILGGADIAFAVRLPWQFYLKVNTDPYLTANGNSTVYGGIENNLSIHKTFARSFDAYAYVNTTWESVPGESWYGYAGFGLGYQVDRNFEIFGAVGFGLDSSSYDYNLRCGLAWRF
jgi:hypothetical protein